MAHIQMFDTSNEVFFNLDKGLRIAGIVNDTAAVVNENGRKIIKAGTPVGAADNFRLDPNNVVLAPVTDGTAQAAVMHDIDITNGPASGTMVIRGDAVLGNMDSDVQPKWTKEVQDALTHIILLKGGK